jgi:hypothetical protein
MVAWTLLHETDDWGDYQFQMDAPTSRFRDMSVNERLFTADLLDDFNKARRDRDRERIIALLLQVGINFLSADRIANAIISKPRR